MKKYIPTIIFTIIFLAGLSVMFYPTVSDFVNSRNSSQAVARYEDAVAALDPEDYTKELEAARAYNNYIESLGSLSLAVELETADESGLYHDLLNVMGNGVMGVIKIPSIQVSLPIYHTTEDSVLQVGAGHYVGSSLPVGGMGTHSILTGHRGLPSAKLFTDLDQLQIGDQFYIRVLRDVLAYQIDQIEVVLPEEVEGLSILADGDFVTLVTCTPYGINSHRMLIRGVRVPYAGEEVQEAVSPIRAIEERADKIDKTPIILVAIVVVIIGLAVFLRRRKRGWRDGVKDEAEKEKKQEV